MQGVAAWDRMPLSCHCFATADQQPIVVDNPECSDTSQVTLHLTEQ
jgi:hypothetical protein